MSWQRIASGWDLQCVGIPGHEFLAGDTSKTVGETTFCGSGPVGPLSQARGHGLVKDRLRIKDATHVLANIAIPAGLQLIAQARNKLLTAAELFAAECVVGERARVEAIRTTTDSQGNEARLVARVEHLRDILEWSTKLSPPDDADLNTKWQTLQKSNEIAQKVLNGHDDPAAPG